MATPSTLTELDIPTFTAFLAQIQSFLKEQQELEYCLTGNADLGVDPLMLYAEIRDIEEIGFFLRRLKTVVLALLEGQDLDTTRQRLRTHHIPPFDASGGRIPVKPFGLANFENHVRHELKRSRKGMDVTRDIYEGQIKH